MRTWVLLFICATAASAQDALLNELFLEPYVSGLAAPTSIKNAGDGSSRLFVTEQRGTIRIIRDGALEPTPFLDIRDRVQSGGERGLLDVAFHPNFESNGLFWVDYTDDRGRTVVSRFKTISTGQADSASEMIFLRIEQPFANHNGGQIVFGPDGYLYVGMGDGGSGGDPGNRAQNLTSLLGKLLRIDVNQGPPARIPPDNPFVGRADAAGEIWAYGLRNPWRFSFDRQTGDLFIGDVGQNAVEEIDFQPADDRGGENYGWRRMEGSSCYDPTSNCNDGSLVQPILEYDHPPGGCGSVTGGYRYRGALHPRLAGAYLFADYCEGTLDLGVEEGGSWRRIGPRSINIGVSTFGEDESGELYLADIGRGVMYRIGLPLETPAITENGVVNAASFSAQGGLAPGTIVSVFGRALATSETQASETPLPTELAASALTVGAQAAPLFFVSPGQINAQMPWELSGLTRTDVGARRGESAAAPVEIALAAYSPGVFTLDQSGSGQAAALIAGAVATPAAPRGSYPGARPAHVGETIEIYATGLGPVSNRPASGSRSPATPLAETVETPTVTIGGESAGVVFSGLTPGFVGLYQVNAELVGDLTTGDAVPLRLTIGGVESNQTTIAVE